MKTHSKITLTNKENISLDIIETGVEISSQNSNDSKKTLCTFTALDMRCLHFMGHDDLIEYFLEQMSHDSNSDEVVDTCESIKDNIKLCLKENSSLADKEKINERVNQSLNIPLKSNLFKSINWTNSCVIAGVIFLFAILIGLRHSILCSLQGGEIRDYKPTYQVVRTGQTFEGDSLQSACVKETPTGYKTLFDIR